MNDKVKPEDKSHRQLAIAVMERASLDERRVMLYWAEKLLAIRSSTDSVTNKIRQAVSATIESKAIWPMVKFLGSEIKRLGWDERGVPVRMAFVAAAAVAAVVGPKAAGLAAFGGAIAVPMWVLFGAGAAFLGVLIEEIRKNSGNEKSRRIVDVEPVREEQQNRPAKSRKSRLGATGGSNPKVPKPRQRAK